MDWKYLKEDISEISYYILKWEKEGKCPDIEKDIVLEKLRSTYSGITTRKLLEKDPEPEPVQPEVNETAVPAPPVEVQSQDPIEEENYPGPANTPVKSDRSKLLSLYGDEEIPVGRDETPTYPSQQSTVKDTEDTTVQEVGPKDNSEGQRDDNVNVAPYNKDKAIISDLYSDREQDMASRISSENTESLKGAIGVNDRYLLIRDLFGGDEQAYQSAITTLDGFVELDEAVLYIYENFNWDPDSETVSFLMELLTRKLLK